MKMTKKGKVESTVKYIHFLGKTTRNEDPPWVSISVIPLKSLQLHSFVTAGGLTINIEEFKASC